MCDFNMRTQPLIRESRPCQNLGTDRPGVSLNQDDAFSSLSLDDTSANQTYNLEKTPMPNESTIIVPVPEAEPLFGVLRGNHDRVAAAGVPAHITLLYPFLPPAFALK